MSAAKKIIGFDRKILLPWLDATAGWVRQGLGPADIRPRLDELLKDEVRGEGTHSAKGKTITVLLHIWSAVPKGLEPLRDDALSLLQKYSGRQRLVLHWGMCMATYPFFRDVASTTGRLLGLQDRAALSQITSRTAEVWGQRSTVTRAAQRIVRSFVEWKVLEETAERGVFAPASRIKVARAHGASAWFLEAGMSNCDRRARPFRNLVTSAAFFPFTIDVTPKDLERNSRIEIYRQGIDEDLVIFREKRRATDREVTP